MIKQQANMTDNVTVASYLAEEVEQSLYNLFKEDFEGYPDLNEDSLNPFERVWHNVSLTLDGHDYYIDIDIDMGKYKVDVEVDEAGDPDEELSALVKEEMCKRGLPDKAYEDAFYDAFDEQREYEYNKRACGYE